MLKTIFPIVSPNRESSVLFFDGTFTHLIISVRCVPLTGLWATWQYEMNLVSFPGMSLVPSQGIGTKQVLSEHCWVKGERADPYCRHHPTPGSGRAPLKNSPLHMRFVGTSQDPHCFKLCRNRNLFLCYMWAYSFTFREPTSKDTFSKILYIKVGNFVNTLSIFLSMFMCTYNI